MYIEPLVILAALKNSASPLTWKNWDKKVLEISVRGFFFLGVKVSRSKLTGRKYWGAFTVDHPYPWGGSGGFRILAGRVGLGQEGVFKTLTGRRRVGLGQQEVLDFSRVGPGAFKSHG